MLSLDHKIPPPVIALVCAGLAWALARFSPGFDYSLPAGLPVAVFLVTAGFALDLSGLLVFRKAKTTINPLSPDRSTAIVQSGPYAFTRNPMYLGMAIALLGLCVFLGNPLTISAVVVFVAYITRFQIIPEERLLLGKFGEPYAQYMRAVRRWI
jgi:protein-S-isoprenylcysteine O-methyltransferase Ste14